jgi:hypothetical protein
MIDEVICDRDIDGIDGRIGRMREEREPFRDDSERHSDGEVSPARYIMLLF